MPDQVGHDVIAGLRGNLKCLEFFRVVEKVVVEILNHIGKFLTVNHETDVHKRSSLRNHVHVTSLQRGECPLQHAVETHDVLSDDRHLRLIFIHDDFCKFRKLRHYPVNLL